MTTKYFGLFFPSTMKASDAVSYILSMTTDQIVNNYSLWSTHCLRAEHFISITKTSRGSFELSLFLSGESHVKTVNFESMPSAHAQTLFFLPVLPLSLSRRSSDVKTVSYCLIYIFQNILFFKKNIFFYISFFIFL